MLRGVQLNNYKILAHNIIFSNELYFVSDILL